MYSPAFPPTTKTLACRNSQQERYLPQQGWDKKKVKKSTLKLVYLGASRIFLKKNINKKKMDTE